MNLSRMMRHFSTSQFSLRKIFTDEALSAIEQSIHRAESNHDGEICFAVEASLSTNALLSNQTARERALEVFSLLHVWDTECNNGVLIYLLLADRDVEIVADRGLNEKITSTQWESICQRMELAFVQQQFEAGVIEGIHCISTHLNEHFPCDGFVKKNELPNKPIILGRTLRIIK